MSPSSYREHDYSFGQQVLVLRTASNLTQSGLAVLCGRTHALRVPLDETWLARLLEKQSNSSAAPAPLRSSPSADTEAPKPGPVTDWGDAPEVSTFYGRASELSHLSDWLLEQRCRVVSVLGMGGVGKSTLAVTLMHRVAHQFDAVIWRSLRDAPPPESLLDEWLRILAGEPLAIVLDSLERRLTLLFEYLRTRRVLLVLDNLESIMEGAEGSGHMLPGYEGYGRLLRRAAETKHKSCLLLTSREKPLELAPDPIVKVSIIPAKWVVTPSS